MPLRRRLANRNPLLPQEDVGHAKDGLPIHDGSFPAGANIFAGSTLASRSRLNKGILSLKVASR